MECGNRAARHSHRLAREEARLSRRQPGADRAHARRGEAARLRDAREADALPFFARRLALAPPRNERRTARRAGDFHAGEARSSRALSKGTRARVQRSADVRACAVSPRQSRAKMVDRFAAGSRFRGVHRRAFARGSRAAKERTHQSRAAGSVALPRHRELDGRRNPLAGATAPAHSGVEAGRGRAPVAVGKTTRQVARIALRTIGVDWSDPPDDWLIHQRWKKSGICPRHGTGLEHATIGGRTTAWCPRCQP